MLGNEIGVIVLKGDFCLGGFVQIVATESDGVVCGSHLQDPCNNKYFQCGSQNVGKTANK